MEIISDLNVLIAAYNKLKSNPSNIMGMGPDSDLCPNNERETRKRKKLKLSLGFREASDKFRFSGHHVLYYHRF
jgi:hypothetical protein